MSYRVGFCCKYVQPHKSKIFENVDGLNTKTTTMSWLNDQTTSIAEQKLWDLTVHNLKTTYELVNLVGNLPMNHRMLRLSSDLLPGYTHENWVYFWLQSDVRKYCETQFQKIGRLARERSVRLSFHPGQFCCIVSDCPDVVENSLDELEYHADMASWMTFGQSKLDFKINIHLSGKQGVNGFNAAWTKMSQELRNMLTLENDEFQIGIDDLLPLSDKVGIVLDVHHHLIKTGQYINANDPRIKIIVDSWNGVRPVIHYSQSKESYLSDHPTDKIIDINNLLSLGYKKAKLRAHSDFMWNQAVNLWAKQHTEWADVQVECKSKNLGAHKLLSDWEG